MHGQPDESGLVLTASINLPWDFQSYIYCSTVVIVILVWIKKPLREVYKPNAIDIY